jgi:DNA-binding transcriptional LysR family regulator
VGCNEPIAAGLLAAIIERLGRKYPRIVCHMMQTPTVATLEYRELRDRHVDLILARIKEPFSDEELQADILFQERLYIVAGKRSKWAARRTIGLADLIDEAWLLPPAGTLPRSLVEEAFRARGLRIPQASVISLSFNLYSSLLPTGRYLAVIPGAVLRYGALRSAVKVLSVEFPVQLTPVAVMSLRHRTLSPAARLFIECAREVAKPLAKSE